MKSIISILSLLLIAGISVSAQTINEIPVNEIDVEYIQLIAKPKSYSTNYQIHIDFGQINKYFSGKDTKIMDADDKKLDFNSMIDALNFMSQYGGYELVSTHETNGVFIYVMKKRQ